MLSYSGITVLSFANKAVRVQPQKFVRSLYGVPRTLQYVGNDDVRVRFSSPHVYGHVASSSSCEKKKCSNP